MEECGGMGSPRDSYAFLAPYYQSNQKKRQMEDMEEDRKRRKREEKGGKGRKREGRGFFFGGFFRDCGRVTHRVTQESL